jgi:transposase
VKVASEPQALLKVVGNPAYRFKRIGLTIPDLAVLVEPMLVVRRALREQIVILYRRLLAIVRNDEVCQRLMTTPGVGPVVALTYRAPVDVPARFRKSKSVFASVNTNFQSRRRGHSAIVWGEAS